MNFLEELEAVSKKTIEDEALTVSFNIQPILKGFAKGGQMFQV